MRKFVDIAVNLTDPMFMGMYNGKQKHPGDIEAVIGRATKAGVTHLIVTGVDLESSKEALLLSQKYDLYCTVGCHPTNCKNLTDNEIADLRKLAQNNRDRVVAVGEFGLDYLRTNFCSIEDQLRGFRQQLAAFSDLDLPLFLHCRDSHDDFFKILRETPQILSNGGVVHSFDGTADHAAEIFDLGLFVGLNGCSLKTAENLKIVSCLPVEKVLLETDSPWCGIKRTWEADKFVMTRWGGVKSHRWEEGCFVQGRNEPACVVQVAEVVSGLAGVDMDELASVVYDNSLSLFFWLGKTLEST